MQLQQSNITLSNTAAKLVDIVAKQKLSQNSTQKDCRRSCVYSFLDFLVVEFFGFC
jgi:hypothetical protein